MIDGIFFHKYLSQLHKRGYMQFIVISLEGTEVLWVLLGVESKGENGILLTGMKLFQL